jgi:hypothetical protein
MAMETSSRLRKAAIGGIAVGLLAVAAVPMALGEGSSGAPAKAGAVSAGRSSAFSWLRPAPAPAGWLEATTASSRGTLFYPPAWKQIPGDKGTVTRSLRDTNGFYVGYLNLTPRQGGEQQRGWAAFRTGHNQAEGDRRVRLVAAAEGLRFRNAHGSCVIDDYLAKVGGKPYREIACLVTGHRSTDVFIGAALKRDWPALSGDLERAASVFVQG